MDCQCNGICPFKINKLRPSRNFVKIGKVCRHTIMLLCSMEGASLIALFSVLLALYGVVASFAWINAKRRNALYWSDLSAPVLVLLLWVAAAAAGYGHQSLSHVVEVPIALIFSLLALNIRVFVIDKTIIRYRSNSYLCLGLSLFVVLLLRTFMPFLPE